MKKNIFFLIISAFIICQNLVVHAASSNFYEAEYIDNIWINRIFSSDQNTIHYQTARFFRQSITKKFVYCIEPTAFFNENSTYNSTLKVPNYLSSAQLERIKALAHFGYQYKNHNDEKWYAITQLLIWKEADPNGDYYFTDSLNGNKINIYEEEINELNNLVNNYIKSPNLSNNSLVYSENQTIIITDNNKALNNYVPSIGKIEDNKLIIDGLKKGTYTIQLAKNDALYNKVSTIFQAENSQDIILPGDNEEKIYISISVINTNLTIHKTDKETKDSKGQRGAKIEGTIYKLYNKKNDELQEITIDNNGYAEIKNIPTGEYYLKEYKAGKGYKLDDNIYTFTISKNTPNIELNLEDEIITKEINIHKTYGDGENFLGEKDIIFQIYDNNNHLVDTIKTDNDGYANITLKYGKYQLIQINSTDGYKMAESMTIDVKDEDALFIELKDYKIEVPNTGIKESFRQKLIKFLLSLIC